MGKEIKRVKKVRVLPYSSANDPEYNITLSNVDGTNNWNITGTIDGMSEEMAETVDIIAENSVKKQTYYKKYRFEDDIFLNRVVEFGFLGLLLATLLLSLLPKINLPSSKKTADEFEVVSDDVLTMYGVNFDAGFFDYVDLDAYDDFSKGNSYYDIAILRGVTNLHDAERNKYFINALTISNSLENLKKGEDIDFNEVIKCNNEILGFETTALSDVYKAYYNPEEEQNKQMLKCNYSKIENMKNVTLAVSEDITSIQDLQTNYTDAQYQNNGTYGVNQSYDTKLFFREEDAFEYYESLIKEFNSHVQTVDKYDEEEELYDGKYYFDCSGSLVEYETTLTQPEFEKYVREEKKSNKILEKELYNVNRINHGR